MLRKRSYGLYPTVPFRDEGKCPVPAFNAIVTMAITLGAQRVALPPDEVQHGKAVP